MYGAAVNRAGAGVSRWRFAARAAAVLATVSAGLLVHAGVTALDGSRGAGEPAVRLNLASIQQLSEISVDDKAQIIVEGEEAAERNAAIPVSTSPLGRVSPFAMGSGLAGTYASALKCLSQAVYYEAANEPMQGRRAVAQVVLNRMRHPGYPKSICGVVYQGSQRRTGCQFSFTCDGSLLRAPAARPWREAQDIARRALAGYVEPAVGTATHYHADYVLPKWAFQLGKIGQLGRHIFYRFNGGWGRAAAFSGHYSGIEQIPAINLAALAARVSEDGAGAGLAGLTPGLSVAPHVTDRHAANDVGGRLDTTRQWRLAIPDLVEASSNYRAQIEASSHPGAAPPERLVLRETPGTGAHP